MYTVCPKCSLTLVVTAADLRAAQGFVRCGRCSNVFNALARLSEDRNAVAEGSASATLSRPAPPPPPPAEAPATSQSPTPSPAAAPTPTGTSSPAAARDPPDRTPEATAPGRQAEEDPIPESALEFDPGAMDIAKVFIEQTPDPKWSEATGRFKALSRAQPSGPTSPAPAPSPFAPPWSADDEESGFDVEIDPELLAATARTGASPSAGAPPPASQPPPPPSPEAAPGNADAGPATAANTSSAQRPGQADLGSDSGSVDAPGAAEAHRTLFADAESQAPVERPALRHLWRLGSAALVLVLVAQVVNHYRHDLAANEHFYAPLTALYSALGVPLVPRWNVKAYDVRQLGASAEGPDSRQLTVRASIRNTARQAQPLPLLRVTLQDRFGNRIAARDVPPGAYLPHAPRGSPFLSAGQRIDAEMAFVDPGSNAVGFEIDACLPAPGGSIACANDAAQR